MASFLVFHIFQPAAASLILLSMYRVYNPIYLEFQEQFTLFDIKIGFSVNEICRFYRILILGKQITAICSR